MSNKGKVLLFEQIGISKHRWKYVLHLSPCSGVWYSGRGGGCVNSVCF